MHLEELMGSRTAHDPDTRSALERTVVESFSEMAFIDAVPTQPGEIAVSHIMHLQFSGPESGELVLHLPHGCKQRIVENIYGEDWNNLHSSEIDDCLLELLNVIAGNFLQVLFGDTTTYDISLPQLLFDDSKLRGEFVECFFDAEGDLMKSSFRIR